MVLAMLIFFFLIKKYWKKQQPLQAPFVFAFVRSSRFDTV